MIDRRPALQAVPALPATVRERSPEESMRFLSDASSVLGDWLDHDTMFERVAGVAVPFLADWCAIDVIEESGRFRRVGSAHVCREKAVLAYELQRRFPPDPALPHGFPRVLREGTPEMHSEIPQENLVRAATGGPEHLALLRALGFRSYMCVPLNARGRTLGAMTFVSAESDRRFGDEDLALAEELARRAAMALDNARLFREAERARSREALLAEASRVLAGAGPNVRAALQRVADISVPSIGDGLLIAVLDENGERPDPIVSNSDPGIERLNELFRSRLPRSPSWYPPIQKAIHSGEAQLVPEFDASSLLPLARSDDDRKVIEQSSIRSLMVVPIKVRSEVLGTLAFSATRSRAAFGPSDMALAQDLAGRIALAIENARLHERAQEALHARDEFLSVASHELRTPITALSLMMRVLRAGVDRGRPMEEIARELGGKLDIADRQVERMEKLVGRLFDLSRIKAGDALIANEELDVGEIAREVIARSAEDGATSPVRLSLEKPVRFVWDRFRLEQVLTNLLSNALKYGEGKPVEIRIAEDGDVLVVEVCDHGTGIPESEHARIFERYARAHRGVPNGLGLGLFIVREVVSEAGGRIELESAPGKGSTFRVRIPAPLS